MIAWLANNFRLAKDGDFFVAQSLEKEAGPGLERR